MQLAAMNTLAFLIGIGVAVVEMWYVGQIGTRALAGLAMGYSMFIPVMVLRAGFLGGAMAAGSYAEATARSWKRVTGLPLPVAAQRSRYNPLTNLADLGKARGRNESISLGFPELSRPYI